MVNMSTKFDKETPNGISLYRVHKVHARTEPRTGGLTDGTTAGLLNISTATRCMGIKKGTQK